MLQLIKKIDLTIINEGMINTSDHKALVAEIRYQSTNKDTNKTKHKKNQNIKIDWENNEIKKYTKEQQNKKWIKLKY
jgi:hypothetical protein